MLKKFFSIFLALMLVFNSPMAFSQESAYKLYIIKEFTGGLNSHINEFLVPSPDNQATIAENVRFNNVYGSVSKRKSLLSDASAGSHSITGLHRFYRSDGNQYTIVTGSTKAYYKTTGSYVEIRDELTDGKRFNFVTYQDNVIMGNGSDNNQKYDGHTTTTADTDGARTASILTTDLGAPYAELDTGTDLDASKWYQYKVAYLVNGAYYYSDARSNPILTGANVHNIALTDIPLGPSGTTARYIYRTLDNSSRANVEADTTFYKIATISDNTTTTLADNMDDTTAAGDAAPTWATASAGTDATPPKGKFLVIHDERLFVTGNLTNKSDVDFSAAYKPDFFDPTDNVQVTPDDGDEIMFIKNFLGILVIGKRNSIQKYYTEGSISTWTLSDSFGTIGSPAPYSVDVTPNGVVYLSRFGIYIFDGQYSTLISDAVTADIRDIAQSNIEECAGVYYDNQYHLAYTSLSSGGAINDKVLVYDFIRDAYAIDTMNVNTFEVFDSGTDTGILYAGTSTTDGYVFSFGSGDLSFVRKLKSQFDAGTYVDSRSYNTETEPIIEIARTGTIDDLTGTIDNLTGTIDRETTTGTWTSAVYRIDANALDKLYWNESIISGEDITFQIRLGATEAATTSASWSTAVSNPSGSDVSGVTANTYIQFKSNLSTGSTATSPSLYFSDGYVLKLVYTKTGSDYETSVLSIWEGGWRDLGSPIAKKDIYRIKVYYTGTSGTINFNVKNDSGDVDRTFSIDVTVDPLIDEEDEYTGTSDNKMYTYIPPVDSETSAILTGEYFKFRIYDNSIDEWSVDKVDVVYRDSYFEDFP